MRCIVLLFLTTSCGGPPTPPAAPAKPTAPACPATDVLIPTLRPLYTDSVEEAAGLEIKIAACQWGSWAGPSFLVHHALPEQPNQEVDSLGGTAIVRADGTLVASRFGDGSQHVTVEGHDLDGDGNDEIFETSSFDGRGMAPVGGSTLSISRVVGKEIVSLQSITTKLETSGIEPEESCEATIKFLPVGRATHLVVTAKRTGDQFADHCLASGRHEFVLDGGKLADLVPPAE
jgi:hypothetical protein